MPASARQRCHAVLAGLVTLATAAVVSLAAPTPARAADTWTETGSDRADPLTESQGLTSVEVPANSPNRYTGIGTIPLGVSSRGWNHVGDPDASYDGYYIEPYQRDSGNSKMFRVQAPGGAWSEYVHTLSAGEALNNSWAAISPDGQWMLSGEWGTMTRLLVFPTPGGNPATSPSANLPQVSTVRLDHAVRDVQGCDFSGPTTLLCSSDDPEGSLFGLTKPLLRIDLSAAPNGTADVSGHVTALRQLPLRSSCSGTFEAEGIDYDRRSGILRVIVVSPGFCVLTDSKTYKFSRS
ncbi:secreted protein [Streptomyces hygroscopicus subsp. jinggangensis 5008]|nr:secreted protein [Streptomyces hygroscopicus subsp. jinggangensis 5008]AGF61713.1 secreted protein [Streptomyces hygroscopicus subsp. jinggangensis TL01]